MCCGPVLKHLLTDPTGTSLVVQWIRLCTPNTGGPGSIPGQGTRFHMLQLKILKVATKTRHSQIKKKKKRKEKKRGTAKIIHMSLEWDKYTFEINYCRRGLNC